MGILLKNQDGILFYAIASDIGYCNNPEEVWLKFSGYLKEDEKELLSKIQNDDITNISFDKLEKYSQIKRQMEVHKLLPKYFEQKCSEEEHNIVYDFVTSSLKKFIESRLTDEEITGAYTLVSSMSKDDLKKFIDYLNGKFMELSVYMAYVLLIANKRYYEIDNIEQMEARRIESAQSASRLRRQLAKDYGII